MNPFAKEGRDEATIVEMNDSPKRNRSQKKEPAAEFRLQKRPVVKVGHGFVNTCKRVLAFAKARAF